MKIKNKGFSLIEVIVYMAIFSIVFTIISNSIKEKKQKQDFIIQKRNISQFIRKVQQNSQYDKKEYVIDFRISENKVLFIKDNVAVDEIKISNNISYMSNNKEKNKNFIRKTTNEGNFEKGFSVYLLDKKGEKIYYRISTNTITAMKYPIISIYRAKKPISVNDDYLDTRLWEEEL